MISEKHKALIEKLITKTANKKANWSKTSREDEYQIVLEKGVITTDRWYDSHVEMVDFAIINDRGDRVSSVTISEAEDQEGFNLLVKLHVLAKESYYKVEETIDEISKELDSNDEIGSINNNDEYDDLPF